MMKGGVWISRRQLRWLLVLLALLPVVPTVLMVRQMLDVAERERDELVAEENRIYRDQLARYVDRFSEQTAGKIGAPKSGAGGARALLEYLEKIFGEDTAIRVTSPAAKWREQSGAELTWDAMAVEVQSGAFVGWKVEVQGVVPLPDGINEQVQDSYGNAALLTLSVVGVAGLVYWVVSRRIRVDVLKADLMSTVSHEMKTPLASMQVLLETLEDGAFGDESKRTEYLGILLRENRRLARLVDQFLTLGRLDRGELRHSLQPVEVLAVCQSAMAMLAPTADERGIRLRLEEESANADGNESQLLALAHRDSLTAVVVNLIDNALKYGPENSLVKVVASGKSSGGSGDADLVRIEVLDDGPALSKREGRRIFERFYQVDDQLNRRSGGVGLGLSISRQLIELSNGKIEWHPGHGGRGNVFFVDLPACVEQSEGAKINGGE